jgi:hypothetical protein
MEYNKVGIFKDAARDYVSRLRDAFNRNYNS